MYLPDGLDYQLLFNTFMLVAMPFVSIGFIVIVGGIIINSINRFGGKR